jgi:aldehyde:ferredoxin oxidoreductase
MEKGFAGKILRVDLNEVSFSIDRHDERWYRQHLGGPAVALHYLLSELPSDVDALSPDNILIFAAGLLTGVPGPAMCRYTVSARSPLTGLAGKSEAGGFWGPELKRAGWDAVVIRGRAAQPSYLWIDGDQIELRPAGHLWGKTTSEAQALIRAELGDDKIRIAQIGPAGENLIRFATISNELAHFNGRSGMGAVMGSKNLRAIAVRGNPNVVIGGKEKAVELGKWVAQNIKAHPLAATLQTSGTPSVMMASNTTGALPTRHWSSGVFEAADQIGWDAMKNGPFVGTKGCYACPIRCKRVVGNGRYDVDPHYGGPEFETLASLGSNCGIGDLELLCKANELCNAYGLDTISTGMTISFAMRCFEEGLLDEQSTGGIRLSFGNGDVLLSTIIRIARREGFGAAMAEGSVRLATTIGRGSERFLVHTKGQELPMHDPRVKVGVGLMYALSGYGADHWVAQQDPLYAQAGSPGLLSLAPIGLLEPVSPLDLGPNKVRAFLYTQMLTNAFDTLGLCTFGFVPRSIITLDRLLDLLNTVTGWNMSLWEVMKNGERVTTMLRLFAERQGYSKEQDTLPDLFFKPIQGGPLDGKGAIDRAQFSAALEEYYQMAGWDVRSGMPNDAKLAELGLGWAKEQNSMR